MCVCVCECVFVSVCEFVCMMCVCASLVPGHSKKSKRSTWYPLFTHAQAVPLNSPYNSLIYIS